jgi:hypothetical protein
MKSLILVAVLWMAPILAYGQQETGKQADQAKKGMLLEAFVNYQYTGFAAGFRSMGMGSGNGFDAGLRLFPSPNSRWGFGFRIGRFSHQIQWENPGGIEPFQTSVAGDGWIAAGDIYLRSRGKRVQPYLFFGLGSIFESHTHHYQSEKIFQDVVSTAAFDIGAGLKIAVTDRLSFAPEWSSLVSGHYRVSQVGIGLTYIIRK